MKTYFHLLEMNFDKIARVNYFTKIQEAEKELNRLKSFFPEIHYEIHPTNSRKEPVIVNC
jgi:hypothetical protein